MDRVDVTEKNMHSPINSIKKVGTAGLPKYGTIGIWIFENEGKGAYFALWKDNQGKIKAAAVNLPDDGSNAMVIQEIGSCIAFCEFENRSFGLWP